MRAECGEDFLTMVYMVRGAKESLLGLAAGEDLGMISIRPEWQQKWEIVGKLQETMKKTTEEGQLVSGGEMQQ